MNQKIVQDSLKFRRNCMKNYFLSNYFLGFVESNTSLTLENPIS